MVLYESKISLKIILKIIPHEQRYLNNGYCILQENRIKKKNSLFPIFSVHLAYLTSR
jgi:hypothetical protein